MPEGTELTSDAGAWSAWAGPLARLVRALLRPRLITTLAWTGVLTSGLTLFVLRAGLSLQMPFGQPERTARIQAWREDSSSAAALLVGDSLVGTDVTAGVLEDELRRTGRSERAFSLWSPGSNLLCDAAVAEYVYARRAEPRVVLLGLGKREIAFPGQGMGVFVRYADPSLAWWLLRHDPSWSNTGVLCASCVKGPSVLLQWPLTLLPQYRAQLADARFKTGSEWVFTPEGGEQHSNSFKTKALPGTPEWREMVEALHSDFNAATPFQPDRTITAALRRLAEVTAGHDCHLIVANMPLCRGRTAIERQYGYDAYLNWLKTSCATSGAQFADLNVERYLPPEAGFFDTEHMKPEAAEHFTRQVTREIILPALNNSRPRGQAQP